MYITWSQHDKTESCKRWQMGLINIHHSKAALKLRILRAHRNISEPHVISPWLPVRPLWGTHQKRNTGLELQFLQPPWIDKLHNSRNPSKYCVKVLSELQQLVHPLWQCHLCFAKTLDLQVARNNRPGYASNVGEQMWTKYSWYTTIHWWYWY